MRSVGETVVTNLGPGLSTLLFPLTPTGPGTHLIFSFLPLLYLTAFGLIVTATLCICVGAFLRYVFSKKVDKKDGEPPKVQMSFVSGGQLASVVGSIFPPRPVDLPPVDPPVVPPLPVAGNGGRQPRNRAGPSIFPPQPVGLPPVVPPVASPFAPLVPPPLQVVAGSRGRQSRNRAGPTTSSLSSFSSGRNPLISIHPPTSASPFKASPSQSLMQMGQSTTPFPLASTSNHVDTTPHSMGVFSPSITSKLPFNSTPGPSTSVERAASSGSPWANQSPSQQIRYLPPPPPIASGSDSSVPGLTPGPRIDYEERTSPSGSPRANQSPSQQSIRPILRRQTTCLKFPDFQPEAENTCGEQNDNRSDHWQELDDLAPKSIPSIFLEPYYSANQVVLRRVLPMREQFRGPAWNPAYYS